MLRSLLFSLMDVYTFDITNTLWTFYLEKPEKYSVI